MAQDAVINGTTYPAVEAVALTDGNGNVTQYYPDAVRYVGQALTEAQKAQARENIGAISEVDVPVKGKDYWTEADQESIVQQVIAALGTPVFGTVDENKHITLSGHLADGTYTISFEDTDGFIVADAGVIEKDNVSYTNLADPSSADWLTDKRLNSSAEIKDQTGSYVTNYIQVKTGDVVRVRGLNIREFGGGNASTHFYDANKSKVFSIIPNDAWSVIPLNGTEFTYTVGNGLSGDTASIQYVRFTGILFGGYTVDDIIITVNEPIE